VGVIDTIENVAYREFTLLRTSTSYIPVVRNASIADVLLGVEGVFNISVIKVNVFPKMSIDFDQIAKEEINRNTA
jgi:hypothetical protein